MDVQSKPLEPYMPSADPAPRQIDAVEPSAEILVGAAGQPQQTLPLATAGVHRWVWESRFGPMLIEVIGDDTYVNGQRVEPA
jgi:hypothetical protein